MTGHSRSPSSVAEHTAAGVLDLTESLVQGATVVVADAAGGIDPGGHLGVYHRDVRVASSLQVTVDGAPPPLLGAARTGPSAAEHVWAVDTDEAGVPTALLIRRRSVAAAVVEDAFELRSFARALTRRVEVAVGVDLATLHKGVGAQPPMPWRVEGDALAVDGTRVGVRVSGPGASLTADPGTLTFIAVAAPGEPWRAHVRIHTSWDQATPVPVRGPAPAAVMVTADDPRWAAAVTSAAADLAALRMRDDDSGGTFTAAGAPWYLCLFGRDSLLAASNALIADVDGALATLEVLAHHQGSAYVPHRLEQPGRILHELRSGGLEIFTATSGEAYFGTADAPALFTMLLAEVHRWGGDQGRVAALLPAARRAIGWCLSDGDADGDGWIEYGGHDGGLSNQGWKDSGDAMVHADGSQATGPIALCEVQAYLIAALEDLALLEERLGDPSAAEGLRATAADRRAAFRRDFWLPEEGIIAMALDGAKRPLRVASSNMGHCLWAGAVDDDVAAAVAARLVQPDLLSDWGLRTLASTEVAYNPLGYHLGTIWPHDTALAAAGLRRYGHDEAAMVVVDRLLRVAARDGGRLPEIYGGLDATDVAAVVAYPTACSPQAWSASAPLLLLRTVLGLDPDVPAGTVTLRPLADRRTPRLVEGIALDNRSVVVSVEGSGASLTPADGGASPWTTEVG